MAYSSRIETPMSGAVMDREEHVADLKRRLARWVEERERCDNPITRDAAQMAIDYLLDQLHRAMVST